VLLCGVAPLRSTSTQKDTEEDYFFIIRSKHEIKNNLVKTVVFLVILALVPAGGIAKRKRIRKKNRFIYLQ